MARISAAEKVWSRSSLAHVMVPFGMCAVATTPYPMDLPMKRNSVEGCSMQSPGDSTPVAPTPKGKALRSARADLRRGLRVVPRYRAASTETAKLFTGMWQVIRPPHA
jgi:hypothetical protein